MDLDDKNIINDNAIQLLRRVPSNFFVDNGNGGLRPSSQAFQNASQSKHDEVMLPHGYDHPPAMSTNIAEMTTVDDCMEKPDDGVVEISVCLVKELGQIAVKTPLPEIESHISVIGNKNKRIRNSFAENCSIVKAP